MSEISTTAHESARFISIGSHVVGKDYRCPSHGHSFHEIVLVYRGSDQLAVEGEVFPVASGEMIILPADLAHWEWNGSDQTLETAFLLFDWPDFDLNWSWKVADRDGRGRQIANWLARDALASQQPSAVLMDTFVQALMGEYLRLLREPPHPVVADLRTRLRQQLDERIELEEIAQWAELSKSHLIRVWKQATGRTPMEDFRYMRLEQARHLILTTNLPLKAIAPQVGLANEHQLSRLLKTVLGFSCRQLRHTQTRPIQSGLE